MSNAIIQKEPSIGVNTNTTARLWARSNDTSKADLLFTKSRTKVCRYCLSEEDDSRWLAPCKCTGTIKWVHLSCFLHWISTAPANMKTCCPICKYVYRRQWIVKPYKLWHWPRLHLRMIDLVRIYVDMILTYRVYRGFFRCLDSKIAFLTYSGYVLLWKRLVVTRFRLNFYSEIIYNIVSSICCNVVPDAVYS